MRKKIKYFLWKLGFWPNNCPYCGKKLMEHGYPPNTRWTCEQGKGGLNDCEFNKKKK